MKLIVTGATGFVGAEVIRQVLRNPAVTSVVALARKPLPTNDLDSDQTRAKLQWVILEDWTSPYPESVKEAIKVADACIWSLAITPSKSFTVDIAEVTKVCFDYTTNGLQNMTALANKPFRFIYVSGVAVERDQSKTPPFLAEYFLMRGRVENAVLEVAKEHSPDVQVTCAKPAGIDGPNVAPMSEAMKAGFAKMFGDTPIVHVSEFAAALIDQCLNGITGDPLLPRELVEIGKSVLKAENYLR